MIFVSVGTDPHPFPRLLNELARLADAKKITGKIIVQCGKTNFTHPKMDVRDFFSIEEFEKLVREADVYITHAGEGNIGTALQSGTPLVIVPRRAQHGEHTDDHQLELANAAEKEGYGIVVRDIGMLEDAVQRAKKNSSPTHVYGFVPRILERLLHEHHIPLTPQKKEGKYSLPKSASIVVATLNGGMPLVKAINGMLNQDFKGKYEVIVVDDGSFDGTTPKLLKDNFGKNPDVTLIFLPRSGVCKARNAGIAVAKHEVIINMDHDDNPQKDWLRIMVSGFDSPSVGAVSGYGHYGGTSTGYRKEILQHLGGYDEDYFYYREDTDLSFKIIELGFEYRKVEGAKWSGDRTLVTPKGIKKMLKYAHQRYAYHMNDVLLHKKHPTPQCEKFLHVSFNHFVNPVEDFKVATGLWDNPEKELAVSSPRGMTFGAGKSPIHFATFVAVGLTYAFGMKLARLAGSLKNKHFLV